MTRLELFRTLPPEALARILLERLDGEGEYCRSLPQCEKALDEDTPIPYEWCVECILLWLKEEIKDEDIKDWCPMSLLRATDPLGKPEDPADAHTGLSRGADGIRGGGHDRVDG